MLSYYTHHLHLGDLPQLLVIRLRLQLLAAKIPPAARVRSYIANHILYCWTLENTNKIERVHQFFEDHWWKSLVTGVVLYFKGAFGSKTYVFILLATSRTRSLTIQSLYSMNAKTMKVWHWENPRRSRRRIQQPNRRIPPPTPMSKNSVRADVGRVERIVNTVLRENDSSMCLAENGRREAHVYINDCII